MSEQIVTSPIITDETGQDILAAIENLADAVKPNAQGVSFDKTGCAVITTNNVQDGMKQLDSGLDTVSSNLAQFVKVEDRTATTTATGAINLNLPFTKPVIQVIVKTTNADTFGWVSATFGNQFVLVKKTDGSIVANTSVSFTVVYLDTTILS